MKLKRPPLSSSSPPRETINVPTSAAAKGHLDVIKWLVEESVQDIDCRNCEKWNDSKYTNFEDYPQQTREYLLKVAEVQNFIGLDGQWKEALLRQSWMNKKKNFKGLL